MATANTVTTDVFVMTSLSLFERHVDLLLPIDRHRLLGLLSGLLDGDDVRGEKRLDLIAALCSPEDAHERFCDEDRSTRDVFGKDIPQVTIAVTPGRDLPNVIETAALDQKLRNLGHDAEKELDEKLMEALNGGNEVSE